MSKAKSLATLTASVALVVVLPAIASAAWTKTGTGTGAAASTSVEAPASATAAPTTGATSTSITVSWTAPASGPAPTGYRVDRVSPAGTVCTVGSATLTCNDTGRTPSTSYSYNVYALILNWDGTASVASSATTASGDTTAPALTVTSCAAVSSPSNSVTCRGDYGVAVGDIATVTVLFCKSNSAATSGDCASNDLWKSAFSATLDSVTHTWTANTGTIGSNKSVWTEVKQSDSSGNLARVWTSSSTSS